MSGESAQQSTRVVGGRYELEALIGKGGVGEVWRARHVALNSRVAIKFLQPASAQKESAKRRFTTEAQVTAQLKTPSAVQVFDFGVTDEGQPYLVMELLEGETLGLRLQRVKRLSVAETARVLAQSARALARAHQLGSVHRDFKPDNIVIGMDDMGRDYVKVVDFGIAKLVGSLEEAEEGDDAGARDDSSLFTRTGAVLGTPLYMAPEQIRDATNVDLRADIWAFGVVAFECLTGRPPFTGSTLVELFQRIQSGLHASATFVEPSVPAGFDAWFEVACAPDADKRFPNATVAWKQLVQALQVPGVDSSPSMSGGFDSNASSGERRVLVVREHEGAVGEAPTLDRRSETTGELRGRTHEGGFASLQRISLDELPALARRSRAAEEPGPSAPPAAASGRKATWWRTAFAVVVALSGVAVWRVAGVTSREAAPTAIAPSPVPSAPATTTTAASPAPTAASTTTDPIAATSPPSVSAAQPVSRAENGRPVRHPPAASASSPAPAVAAAPPPTPAATTASPSRTSAPTAPAPPTDPGGYR